ncbi:MAG: ABC transporter permease [Clostridiales Family XIII bacterium]|jgi:NitT/TauT family transport system permease protein|nr:ABC transporter permease [Clostridiales Family XIII bacterium]
MGRPKKLETLEKRGIGTFLYKGVEKSLVIVILLAAWFIIPLFRENMFVPPLGRVLGVLGAEAASGSLWLNILATLKLCLFGLFYGVLIALPVGLAIGWYKAVEAYVDPLFQVLRNTSTLSLLPVVILFFGANEFSKILLISWATFFVVVINTIQGVKNADPVLIQSARSMGIGSIGLFRKVVLPAASPYILAGVRLAASDTLIIVIGAEMLGAFHGLGYTIFKASASYMFEKMYAYILTIAILGVLFNMGLIRLENRLTRWQDKSVLS